MSRLVILIAVVCALNASAEENRRQFLRSLFTACGVGLGALITPARTTDSFSAGATRGFYPLSPPRTAKQAALGLDTFGQGLRDLVLREKLVTGEKAAEALRWKVQGEVWQEIEARKATLPAGAPAIVDLQVHFTEADGRGISVPVRFEVVKAATAKGPLEFEAIRLAANSPAGFGLNYRLHESDFFPMTPPRGQAEEKLGLEAFGKGVRELVQVRGLFANEQDAERARWKLQDEVWKRIETEKASIPPGSSRRLSVQIPLVGDNGQQLIVAGTFELVRAKPTDGQERDLDAIRFVSTSSRGYGVSYKLAAPRQAEEVAVRFRR